ncbi:DUF6392 family protein [Pseudomonas japonica]|uniref:DUF6392 family protein n=1 Tax=Pseudomonas japonica TaxID=256466 RepID=UPI00381DB20C
MDAKTIESWIDNLGQSYETLLANGLVNQPLQELYTGRDWLDVEPTAGLELSFWSETRRFERLFISLISVVSDAKEYRGELPRPFVANMTQSEVRAAFGKPMESQGPTRLPLNRSVGGFDTYQLDSTRHPNTKVSFQYTSTMQVKTLVFSLIDRSHD